MCLLVIAWVKLCNFLGRFQKWSVIAFFLQDWEREWLTQVHPAGFILKTGLELLVSWFLAWCFNNYHYQLILLYSEIDLLLYIKYMHRLILAMTVIGTVTSISSSWNVVCLHCLAAAIMGLSPVIWQVSWFLAVPSLSKIKDHILFNSHHPHQPPISAFLVALHSAASVSPRLCSPCHPAFWSPCTQLTLPLCTLENFLPPGDFCHLPPVAYKAYQGWPFTRAFFPKLHAAWSKSCTAFLQGVTTILSTAP